MNKESKIDKIFEEMKEEYKYGGSEDSEGGLASGYPDFDKGKRQVNKVIKEEKQNTIQEFINLVEKEGRCSDRNIRMFTDTWEELKEKLKNG